MLADVIMLVSPNTNIIFPRMNDNCITKVVVFRRIAMGSLVGRYIVTKGQVKPLLDACIIFPRVHDE